MGVVRHNKTHSMKVLQCFMFFLCGSFVLIANGQNLKGVVVNSETNEPLPYTNVGILNKDIGTVTNDDGSFILDISKLSTKDTIRISFIGYKTFDFLGCQADPSKETKIRLQPLDVKISEVQVNNAKSKHIILGNTNKSHSFVSGFSGMQLGGEFGTLIKVKHRGLLEQIRFHIASTTYDSLVFRVNIYDVVNGLPCHNILKEQIVIRPNIKTGDMIIDISDYNIYLDEDFVICLENIKKLGDDKSKFFLTIGTLNNPSFRRPSSQGKWQLLQFKKIKFGIGINVKMRI